ncbi:MAG TPA: tRNA (adenosine(37)-N6)-threonylcarbamoyltransferase complex transferase subunit TsaD [Saprospiraceae bacterium]|nr:tRNA (adenosine(37)-N6)-threonylcarbamoyltransferase complex transferase subunit TsaD [Saprospiraceae bacterium]HMQ81356.1 tRNA (adenosine(37)-N6)-threonylcarbamoyltransferase complex transferase subunit TsaD [Saprospiraceae bacterium]
MSVILLGIESSCDDTAAAVIKDGVTLSNVIATQQIHHLYGGVVPEVASRAHQLNIIPVVDQAIKEAGIEKEAINAVAFTRGPGLIGSLLVGVSFAKSFALSLNIPLIEINHMEAHILAHFAEEPKPPFPFLCLTVSGGHTQIVQVNDYFSMTLLGQTIDDAAGEAFDKTGKLLGLDYPAGPLIDQLAQQGQAVYEFPEPQIPDLGFSFSGLKTSILYFLKAELAKNPAFIEENKADICASVQQRIVSILLKKLKKAVHRTGITEVALAGGVSANSALRKGLEQLGQQNGWNTYIPRMAFCTDNAAMIAVAGYYKYLKGEFTDQSVAPVARWAI